MHFPSVPGGFAERQRGFFSVLTLLRRRRSRSPKRLGDWLLVDDGWRALIVAAHVRLYRDGTGGDGVSRGGGHRRVGGRRVDLLRPRPEYYSVSLRELVRIRTSVLARFGNSR